MHYISACRVHIVSFIIIFIYMMFSFPLNYLSSSCFETCEQTKLYIKQTGVVNKSCSYCKGLSRFRYVSVCLNPFPIEGMLHKFRNYSLCTCLLLSVSDFIHSHHSVYIFAFYLYFAVEQFSTMYIHVAMHFTILLLMFYVFVF